MPTGCCIQTEPITEDDGLVRESTGGDVVGTSLACFSFSDSRWPWPRPAPLSFWGVHVRRQANAQAQLATDGRGCLSGLWGQPHKLPDHAFSDPIVAGTSYYLTLLDILCSCLTIKPLWSLGILPFPHPSSPPTTLTLYQVISLPSLPFRTLQCSHSTEILPPPPPAPCNTSEMRTIPTAKT